jgi:hypothetical protein
MGADPFLGTWKTNPHRSTKTSTGKAPTTTTLTVTAIADGYQIASAAQPKPFILHLDGKDYKDETQGVAALLGADHSSARRINAQAIETTFKRKGTIVGTLRRELSPHGKSMTSALSRHQYERRETSVAIIFDKQ